MSQTAVLGISAFAHDTASSLVDKRDGRVLYALAEERLSNLKHDSRFPIGSVRQALEFAERNGYAVTDVALNTDSARFLTGRLAPLVRELISDSCKADGLISDLVALHQYPDYYLSSGYSLSTTHIERLIDALDLTPAAAAALRGRLVWHFNWAVKYRLMHDYCRQAFPHADLHVVSHHLAHAASAYFGCGFEDATILVIDGQGECDSVSIFSADRSGLKLVSSTNYPFSLGLFYLTCTEHLGFSLGDEYKVMGMAAYGRPSMFDRISPFINVTSEAELRFCDNDYFALGELRPNSGHAIIKAAPALTALVPRRDPGSPIGEMHFDFAASVQLLTEKTGLELARAAIALTGKPNLVMTGGVALNGLMNEEIRRKSGCSGIFVYPAAGDDGTAVGAAQHIAMRNGARASGAMRTCFYGNASSDADIATELARRNVKYTEPRNIYATIAEALARGKVVARFVGSSEFGPRALGNRSILADPRDARMRDVLNIRIKHRENFRPFAPACLRERVEEYFDLNCDAPFMLLICPVKKAAQARIPAIVHQDGTARVQSVDRESNPEFHRVISEFDRITGVPVVINTSFNVNGEAIVDTAADAIESFQFMDIDYLAIGSYWVAKEDNANHPLSSLPHDQYLDLRRKRYAELYSEPLGSLDLALFNAAFFADQPALEPRGIARSEGSYWLGELLSFARGGHAAGFQLAGWSDPEPWGTWTDGPAASLEFPFADMPHEKIRLTCFARGYTSALCPQQTVSVAVNGRVIERWTFHDGDAGQSRHATIPADIVAERKRLRIDFLISDPTAPADLGLSDDRRRLGIGIQDLVLAQSA